MWKEHLTHYARQLRCCHSRSRWILGCKTYQLLDKSGKFVPQVDPFMQAYRPDGRALNYRSEPFMNRLALQQATTGTVDAMNTRPK